ncbi:MAG: hypothetical protein NXI30_17810 [bacterium]|nr:hypothetical protein [bacterium]
MIDPPRVNPVGVTEIPDGFVRTPRRHPFAVRCFAAVLALVFVAVVLGTGAASLATWCLTSDAGSPFPFR